MINVDIKGIHCIKCEISVQDHQSDTSSTSRGPDHCSRAARQENVHGERQDRPKSSTQSSDQTA